MKRKIAVVAISAILAITLGGCFQNGGSGDSAGQSGSSGSSSKSSSGEYDRISLDAATIDGEKFSSESFRDHRLTMVNVWATFCSPCIREMDELQALYEEFAEKDVDLIGIIADTPGLDTEKAARRIISSNGVRFTNVIPSIEFLNGFLRTVEAVPTTYFVDSEGAIVGDAVVGAVGIDNYRSEMEKRLKEVE